MSAFLFYFATLIFVANGTPQGSGLGPPFLNTGSKDKHIILLYNIIQAFLKYVEDISE